MTDKVYDFENVDVSEENFIESEIDFKLVVKTLKAEFGEELTEIYKTIYDEEKNVAENKALADNGVLTECHDLIRVGGIKASHPIDEYVVMFASKKILNTFSHPPLELCKSLDSQSGLPSIQHVSRNLIAS